MNTRLKLDQWKFYMDLPSSFCSQKVQNRCIECNVSPRYTQQNHPTKSCGKHRVHSVLDKYLLWDLQARYPPLTAWQASCTLSLLLMMDWTVVLLGRGSASGLCYNIASWALFLHHKGLCVSRQHAGMLQNYTKASGTSWHLANWIWHTFLVF